MNRTATAHDYAEEEYRAPLHLIRPVPDLIKDFPTTRYYGSKRKLLTWMYSHLGNVQFDTALDAFGGTASVSLLFQAMRKRVTYHDAFHFNQDVARTVLGGLPTMDRKSVEAAFSSVKPRVGVVATYFSGIFYTDDENAWLDGFMAALDSLSKTVEDKALLRYLIYQACLKKRPFNLFHRANLSLRTTTNIKRSFGNAVTWERSFVDHALQAYDELTRRRSIVVKPATFISPGDASEIRRGYDLVYIDPPYINPNDRLNRDDYWRRYHFLEGLSRYGTWDKLIDLGSDVRCFSPENWFVRWGRAGTFKDRLFNFIDKHRDSIVVLSYVSYAVPSEAEIIQHFESKFSRVSIHFAAHSHALSKNPKRELLFIGFPR